MTTPQIRPPQQQVAVPEIAPSAIAQNVSESDSTTYANVRGVWVGSTGNLAVTMNGQTVTFNNVPDGTLLPISPTQFLTASTASNVVFLF